jgi:hypothetical protein
MALVVVPVTHSYNGVTIRVLDKDNQALVDIRETALDYETGKEILTQVGVTLNEKEWTALVDMTPHILTEAKEHPRRQHDPFSSLHCINVNSRLLVYITLHGRVKLLKFWTKGRLEVHSEEWATIFEHYKNHIGTLIEELSKTVKKPQCISKGNTVGAP